MMRPGLEVFPGGSQPPPDAGMPVPVPGTDSKDLSVRWCMELWSSPVGSPLAWLCWVCQATRRLDLSQLVVCGYSSSRCDELSPGGCDPCACMT